MFKLFAPAAPIMQNLIRTRMSGGVGRAVSDGGPYPISSVCCGNIELIGTIHDSSACLVDKFSTMGNGSGK